MFYYCGIDVAKHKHAVALLDEQGAPRKPGFAVENTRAGLDKLGQELAALNGTVMVGLEATGHYWLSLYDVLTRQGYAVVVINPLQVAAYRKSGVRKLKTDKTDAVWIADFLRIAHLPATSRDIPVLLQLRELSRFRYWLSDQIGDCKRKLLTILDRVFPEYESLFSSVFIQSSRALLQEAVSAQDFANFDLSELTQLLHRSSRGRFGADKAEQLQQQAKEFDRCGLPGQCRPHGTALSASPDRAARRTAGADRKHAGRVDGTDPAVHHHLARHRPRHGCRHSG